MGKYGSDEKRWTDADAIRQELENKGILVMDLAEGTAWRVRLEASEAEKRAARGEANV